MALYAEIRGAGRQVVCLPPFGADRSMMLAALEPVFDGLTGWQRTYVDLPGCGRSPAGPSDSDGVVAVLADFVEPGGPDRPLLVGWSYGGYLAAALARRWPERFGGLLLICPGVRADPAARTLPDPPPVPAPEGWLDRVPPHLVDHLAVALGNRTGHVAERVAAALAAMPPGDEEYLRRLRTAGYRLSDEGRPAGYPGPTCVVTGRYDRIAGFGDQFRELADYPDGTFTVLAGAGHYLPFEQPFAFRTAVRDWLSRCGSGLDAVAALPEKRRWPA